LSPERLQLLLTLGGEPAGSLERDALALARRLGRVAAPGPSAAEASRLTRRFHEFVARNGRPRGVGAFMPNWLAAPAAQRLAAAALLLGGLSAGGTALGYTPVDATRDAGNVVVASGDLVANIVRNLNPNRDPSEPGSVPDPSPTPAGTTTTPAASTTPAPAETFTAGPTTPTAATPSTPLPEGNVQTVSAGEAGSVDIRQQGEFLEVVAVNPAAGWTPTVLVAAGDEVDIRFDSGARSVELKVDTEDGVLDPELEFDDASSGDDDDSSSDDDSSGDDDGSDD
jgi:hypothetical protein